MAKVSRITVEEEVTEIVEQTRYILELTHEEAREVRRALDGRRLDILPRSAPPATIRVDEALFDAGVFLT